MQVVWLLIIAVCAVPLVYVAWLLNPLLLLLFGPEWWQERMAQLLPYRRRIVVLTAVFVFALTVYLVRYG